MNVIINADDLGVNRDVNEAIKNALEKGAISSSTILANTPFIDEVRNLVTSFPSCSFGLHLNITEGESLTHDEGLLKYRLIDEDGLFNKERAKELFRTSPSAEVKEYVYREWKAQIQRLLGCGIMPSHFDGHHHCHAWPGLRGVTVRLAEEFSIKKIRNMLCLPQTSALSIIKHGLSKGLLKTGFCDLRYSKTSNGFLKTVSFCQNQISFNDLIKEKNLLTTDYFAQYSVFLSHIDAFGDIGNKTIELMCHPGHPLFSEEYAQILNKGIVQNSRLLSYYELK